MVQGRMICRYCGARNSEDEHRCSRCGRRLGEPLPPAQRSSAVPAPVREASRVIALPEREAPPARAPRQQDLFHVIPFDTIAPPRPKEEQGARRPPPRRSASRVPDPNQTDLPFAQPAAPAARPAALAQGPVASIRSRSQAGIFDASVVVAGVLLFLLLTRFWESELPFERSLLWAPIAVLGLILSFYKVAFCLLSDRSPGMRMAGLRLLHVSGRPAGRRERLVREFASLLSLLPGGIGYLWALVDEERLTFHDHISETFPSPDPPAR